MSVDLIIHSSPSQVVIAILQDKQLVELHKEGDENNFNVGDIYLGRVKKVMPGLNAAFIDVGYEKDAFLHYLDLGPQFSSLSKYTKRVFTGKQQKGDLDDFEFEPDIDKGGKIGDVLKANQGVVVQITKEPISTKGPRLNSELSIAGRYIVLVPFSDRISVSQKIRNQEEKDRLKRLIQSIKPPGFGVIIRTVAEDKKVADLHADLNHLVNKWDRSFKKLRRAKPPTKILGEMSRVTAILRDLLNADFNNIYVDDPEVLAEVKEYIMLISPKHEKILHMYEGKIPIFDHFGVERQIKSLFGKTVTMKSGAYLVIEHTEALHVVDVNSGQRSKSDKSQEENALEVNIESATEIARQLKLRDMGGIIVIDFIDMREEKNRKLLFEKMKEAMKGDRAKYTVLPPSKFGLVQITRQRVRPEMEIITAETCPSCGGGGKVQAPILLMDEIENKLKYVLSSTSLKQIVVCVHPFVEAYINKGWFSSVRKKWQKELGKKIEVRPMMAYQFLEYGFLDKKGDPIELKS